MSLCHACNIFTQPCTNRAHARARKSRSYPAVAMPCTGMHTCLVKRDNLCRMRVGDRTLGCDGGSAVVTLRAMDKGLLPAAPVLIIEANTLSYALEDRGREIAAAIGSDWFKLGSRFPNVGATARPTAFAYSWLMARKESAATASGELAVSTKPMRLSAAEAPVLDAAASALVDELVGILGRLEAKGSRVILVMLPPGVKAGGVQADLPRALACKSGLPWWDLNDGIAPGSVGFTDGLHLDAPSASKVLNALIRAVDSR